ncbi:response regulator transcription factor [Cytophagales bacterium RKSG123]|nr:response regulator transcription factor [Xanthovirga aplysinae]
MIGDKILLNFGDSISRVMPIEKDLGKYKIQFEADFEFNPEELVTTINQVIKETEIANSYLVEVENCESNKVVYSYEMGNSVNPDMIPCKTRNQPKSCYALFITILNSEQQISSMLSKPSQSTQLLSSRRNEFNYFNVLLTIISILLLIGLILYTWRNKHLKKANPDIIPIGKYQFDKKGMILSNDKEKTELSSKEADLLYLLFTSKNKTLNREYILNIVWGDEGDYVGRTLDVFISKLRKKLGADSSLKIVNIRGVGYKFIMNAR